MLRVIKRKELSRQGKVFELWQYLTRRANEHDQKIHKENIVSNVWSISQHKGNCLDKLQQIKSGSSKLEQKLQKQGRQILANTFCRLVKGNLYEAFDKWKCNIQLLKSKQVALQKLLTRATTSYQQLVLSTWNNWVHFADAAKRQSKYHKKLREREQLLQAKEFKRCNLGDEMKLSSDMKQLTYAENVEFMSKAQKSTALLRSQKDSMYSVSKIRIILQEWHRVASDSKTSIMKIEKFMDIQLLKKSLLEIKTVADTKSYVGNRRKILKKFVININRIK